MVSSLRFSILSFSLTMSLLTARADDQVRSTQEELRRRNVYFGEIDGAPSPELTAALKHYQARKGFAATGQPDAETLRSLDLLPRQPGEAPPKELAWPREPVLKSDVTIDVPRAAESIARETGVSPSSIAPAAGEKGSPHSRGPRSARPAALADAGDSAPPGRSRDRHAKPPAIGEFINDYLKAAGRNDLHEEIRFYADHLTYFHNGSLDRRIVERTLRDYDRHWSRRRTSSVGRCVSRICRATGRSPSCSG